MQVRLLLTLILYSVVPAADAGALEPAPSSLFSGWTPFAAVHAWRATDIIAVSKFDGEWREGFSPRAGRNVALMRNWATAGAESSQWRIGYEMRHDAVLDTDRETLELVRLYKHRRDPDAPRAFTAHATYRAWSAYGLRVGRKLEGPQIAGRPVRMVLSAAWYADMRYRRNEAAGSVRYLGAGNYAFDGTELDMDSRARLPFFNATPEGSGLSMSVAAEIPLSTALTLDVRIEDLWSRIRWRHLPVTRQTINSNVAGLDSEGFLNYRPLLSGRNTQINDFVTLPRYGAAELSYRTGAWRYAMQVERFASVTIPTISAQRHFSWGNLLVQFETRFHTLGLGYAYGNFRLQLQADAINQNKAKTQAISLHYVRAY